MYGTKILQIYWIYNDAIDLTSRWKVRFRQTPWGQELVGQSKKE